MALHSRTDGAGGGKSAFRFLKERKNTLKRMAGYLFMYRGLLIAAFFMAAVGNGLALAGPLFSGYAIDAVGAGEGRVDFGRVLFYVTWMAVFYVLSALLSYGLSALMITISRRVVRRMREDVFHRMLALPVGYFDRHQTGELLSRISYDIDVVNESLSSDLIQMLTTVITVGGALLMMVMISPYLVLVFCFTVPLSVCITRFITSRTRPLFRTRSAALGNLNGFGEEKITGQKTIKAYCGEEGVIEDFKGKNQEAVEAYYKAEYYASTVGPMVNFINNLSLSLISVFGALLYLSGYMRVGQISSFVLYSRKFSGPINELANIVSDLQSAVAAAERVFGLLDELPEETEKEQTGKGENKGKREDKTGEAFHGRVELSHVEFGYEPRQKILKDFSFEAKPGEMIAVVGPTGAGKTTLINLLMRFYDPQSGEIRADGRNIRTISRKQLRSAYAMVLQDTWLFYGTVYENLAYGRENVTREEVEAAARAAQVHSFIMQLPQGYDTVLREDGANISKGQKQLLTIARAMLLPCSMVILDEATSNVDTRTEVQIQNAMLRLMKGKTCFIIAHRLSTIQNADQILVVDQGQVAEQGSHEELMGRRGIYYQMQTSQGNSYVPDLFT